MRVIRIRTNSNGTAKNEQNAHTSGSAYGIFFLNLFFKLNNIHLIFKNNNFLINENYLVAITDEADTPIRPHKHITTPKEEFF